MPEGQGAPDRTPPTGRPRPDRSGQREPDSGGDRNGNAHPHHDLPATAGRNVPAVVLVRRVRNLAAPHRPEFEIARWHVVPVNRPTLFHYVHSRQAHRGQACRSAV